MPEKQTIERHRLRVLRGRILRALRHVFGERQDALAFESIRHCVGRDDWSAGEIREQLKYLLVLNYIEAPDRRRDALDDDPYQVYSLSAKGLRLLGGEIEDSSIEAELAHD